MNSFASPTLLSARDPEHDRVVQHISGAADFDFSSDLCCHYDPLRATLWTNWRPSGVPCFSIQLLHTMERGSQTIEGYFAGRETDRPLRHIIVRSLFPQVFSLGGDLAYFQRLIAAGDKARLIEYARAAINVTYRNYVSHNIKGVTTIALLEGDALGGGFESALSCDIVVAEKHVKAGFPEVLFDMFPGMGGLSFLARRVGRNTANELTRSGRQYSARELLDMGVIDYIVDSGKGLEEVTRLMRQREQQHSAHSAMNVVDRLLRPVTLQELTDVVQLWVDSAMKLSPRSLQWMRRLHQQQVAAFGCPLELVPRVELSAA
jgi:DSF synthase